MRHQPRVVRGRARPNSRVVGPRQSRLPGPPVRRRQPLLTARGCRPPHPPRRVGSSKHDPAGGGRPRRAALSMLSPRVVYSGLRKAWRPRIPRRASGGDARSAARIVPGTDHREAGARVSRPSAPTGRPRGTARRGRPGLALTRSQTQAVGPPRGPAALRGRRSAVARRSRAPRRGPGPCRATAPRVPHRSPGARRSPHGAARARPPGLRG